jgi:hypothetical protein
MNALLLFTFTPALLAAEPAESPRVTTTGVVFARYGYDLTEGSDGANAFGIDRAYVGVLADLDEHLATRITLDADKLKPVAFGEAGEATVDTKYRVFLKHAWLEWKDAGPGVKMRFGMIDTPWTGTYDNFVGLRYVTESFAKNSKVLETADLGVSAIGSHQGDQVSWHAALVNGEGYGKNEVDAGKAVQVRGTFDPLARTKKRGMPVSAFVSYAGNPTTETPVLTWAGAVGFKAPRLVAWGEVLGVQAGETESLGYSLTASPRLPRYGGVLVRYDHFDADSTADGGATDLVLAGVTHDWRERVSTAVTYERTTPEGSDPTHGVVVHLQAGY